MNFWWVNHSQTSKQELSGGYIWSPRTNKDGSRNQTYLNLKNVRPHDVIFSFANGKVGAVGIVEADCIPSERPTAFGKSGEQWAREGWRVSVRWTALTDGLRPQDHLNEIVPLLPEKYAPIRTNGYGNQKFYLVGISESLGRTLLTLSQQLGNHTSELVEDLADGIKDDIEELTLKSQDIPELEREQLIKARRGQGIFRFNVERVEKGCRVTGVVDRRFVIASHIKPWRSSTNKEKLDGHNGLLLSPHVDRLFDRGWISFTDHGTLLCAHTIIEKLLPAWGLEGAKNVGAFSARQRAYLHYHRTHCFKNV
jgi:putative restriction endonuclease